LLSSKDEEEKKDKKNDKSESDGKKNEI